MWANQYSCRSEYLKKVIHALFAMSKELIEQFLEMKTLRKMQPDYRAGKETECSGCLFLHEFVSLI